MKQLDDNEAILISNGQKELKSLIDNVNQVRIEQKEEERKSKSKEKTQKQLRPLTSAFGKLMKPQDVEAEMKLQFQKNIDKLNEVATRELGYKECKAMILKYCSESNLKAFASILNNTSKRSSLTAGSKEYQILIIGFIAAECNPKLFKPDFVKLLTKTLIPFMDDSSNIIHKAVSLSANELFKAYVTNQTSAQNDTQEHLLENISSILESCFQIFVLPFTEITVSQSSNDKGNNGSLVNISTCSSVILSDLISYLTSTLQGKKHEKEGNVTQKLVTNLFESIVFKIYDSFIGLIQKYSSRLTYSYIYDGLGFCICYFGLEKLLPRNPKGFEKLIASCTTLLSSNQVNLFSTKTSCCIIFYEIFGLLRLYKYSDKQISTRESNRDGESARGIEQTQQFFNSKKIEEIKKVLIYASKDRILKVQQSATDALNSLTDYINFNDNQNLGVEPGKLSKLNLLRTMSKFQKSAIKSSLEEYPRSEVLSKGLTNYLTTKQFMDKKELKQRSTSKSIGKYGSGKHSSSGLRNFINERQNSKSKGKNDKFEAPFQIEDEQEKNALAAKSNKNDVSKKSSSFSENDDAIYYRDKDRIKRYKKSKSHISYKETEEVQDNLEKEPEECPMVPNFQLEELNPDQCEVMSEKDIPLDTDEPNIENISEDHHSPLRDLLLKESQKFEKLVTSFENKISRKLNKLSSRIETATTKLGKIDLNFNPTMNNSLNSTMVVSHDISMENPLSFKWMLVVEALQKGDIDQAFEIVIIDMDDDIYFLRLCHMLTTFDVKAMTKHNSICLVKKLSGIIPSEKFQLILIDFFETIVNSYAQTILEAKLYDKLTKPNSNRKSKQPSDKKIQNRENDSKEKITESELATILDILVSSSDKKDKSSVKSLDLYSRILSWFENH